MIILVAAMSRGRVIGKAGGLPWGHGTMKTDQARYRQMVDGQTIVLGAGTYDPANDYVRSAGHVFLLTNQNVKGSDNLTAISSIEPVLELAKLKDVYVLGGAGVFTQFIEHADKLELTYIDADYEGDKLFPEFDESEWEVANEESHQADADNMHPYNFVTLIRASSGKT